MIIDLQEADGFQLRLRRGKWYLALWLGDLDLEKDYGPFSHAEAEIYVDKSGLIDIDRKHTSEKVNRENEGLKN